jgi:hypothetical protein
MLAPPYFTGRDRGAIEVTIVRNGGARKRDIPVLFSFANEIFKSLKYNSYLLYILGLFTVETAIVYLRHANELGYVNARYGA